MKTTGSLLTILTALTLPLCASAQNIEPDGLIDSGKIVVAINDFVGTERKSARQLSEILLSDLAKQHLQTVERADLRQTFDDLEITTGVALTAAQVRKAGGAVHATRFVVGAFSRDDADRFVIKARVLDAATGAPIADKALTIIGEPDDLPALAHRLAKQLLRNLQDREETPEAPVPPSDGYRKGELPVEDASGGEPAIKPGRKSAGTPIERDSLALFRSEGLVPESAEEADSVSESEFATLWLGAADPKTLRLTYCGAGHDPPMVFRIPADRPMALPQSVRPRGRLDALARRPSSPRSTTSAS